MDAIEDLLGKRRQQLDQQQIQLVELQSYLADHYPDQIEIAATPDQLSLLTTNPATASQLQLDWANLIRYCQTPKQQLVVRVKPAGG